MLRYPTLLIAALLLSACESAFYQDQFYPAASGDDTVELLFSSDGLPVQPLICLPGSGWRATPQAVGRGEGKVFDDLNKVLGKAREVSIRVPAGEVLAGFRYRESGRYTDPSRCQVEAGFVAEAGDRIQLLFRRDDQGQCRVDVNRRDQQIKTALATTSPNSCQ